MTQVQAVLMCWQERLVTREYPKIPMQNIP